jgi:hypothetical protein
MDWTTGARSPEGAKDFSSSLCIQTSSGAQASYPMGTGGKAQPGHDTDHSPPSSDEVKKKQELYTASSSKHLHGMQRNGFTYYNLTILNLLGCYKHFLK